jgi:hypothetical protein
VSLFAQNTSNENIGKISAGYIAVTNFLYWVLSDVFHKVFNENQKKIFSVATVAVVGIIVCAINGYNPIAQLGIFGAFSFVMDVIQSITGYKVNPFSIGKKVSTVK